MRNNLTDMEELAWSGLGWALHATQVHWLSWEYMCRNEMKYGLSSAHRLPSNTQITYYSPLRKYSADLKRTCLLALNWCWGTLPQLLYHCRNGGVLLTLPPLPVSAWRHEGWNWQLQIPPVVSKPCHTAIPMPSLVARLWLMFLPPLSGFPGAP